MGEYRFHLNHRFGFDGGKYTSHSYGGCRIKSVTGAIFDGPLNGVGSAGRSNSPRRRYNNALRCVRRDANFSPNTGSGIDGSIFKGGY
jgi:hypothetical protein